MTSMYRNLSLTLCGTEHGIQNLKIARLQVVWGEQDIPWFNLYGSFVVRQYVYMVA